ncbi:hypothetical protein LCM02_04760 [Lutimonas saemankumensis]|uniref:hypothetical protein n=1 Tax=Lutimonas saemankumensis TaxID=483016 RepID=UPI001CD2169F|nr:hypothetical protein [Lutimonas saemankumensis]MCA0931752.1 hypothetical protein [Lutimonas saemankumensis]
MVKCNYFKSVLLLICFLAVASNSITAQEAPVGKKTLKVEEKFPGEYLQEVSKDGLSSNVIDAMKSRLPKKLEKFGFTDITITEVGQVPVPKSIATKMGNTAGNTGRAELEVAQTYGEIERAVDKMYQEPVDIDWKFQVNFIDNNSGNTFKVRLNLSYNPQYIISE